MRGQLCAAALCIHGKISTVNSKPLSLRQRGCRGGIYGNSLQCGGTPRKIMGVHGKHRGIHRTYWGNPRSPIHLDYLAVTRYMSGQSLSPRREGDLENTENHKKSLDLCLALGGRGEGLKNPEFVGRRLFFGHILTKSRSPCWMPCVCIILWRRRKSKSLEEGGEGAVRFSKHICIRVTQYSQYL